MRRRDLNRTSLVSKGQFIQVDIVGLLFVIAVLLIVDGHAVPSRIRSGVEGPVQVVRHSIQRDGFIQQLVAGSPLHFEGEMVP